MPDNFRQTLETFPNQYPGRDYTIEIVCPEFTSVCPKTGQPDFGTLTITYTPEAKCVELKSLKLYLQQFRNEGIFYESVTNRILDDLVAVLAPRRMKLLAAFTPRGGISTNVIVGVCGPSQIIKPRMLVAREISTFAPLAAFSSRGIAVCTRRPKRRRLV